MQIEDHDHLISLLSDIQDDNWVYRIVDSVRSIEILFDIKLQATDIRRGMIEPAALWVATVDELDLPHAVESIKIHGSSPPPVTVVFFEGSYYLFMGAVRALMYVLDRQEIDAIIVDVSRANKIAFPISGAQITLGNFLARNRLAGSSESS